MREPFRKKGRLCGCGSLPVRSLAGDDDDDAGLFGVSRCTDAGGAKGASFINLPLVEHGLSPKAERSLSSAFKEGELRGSRLRKLSKSTPQLGEKAPSALDANEELLGASENVSFWRSATEREKVEPSDSMADAP